MKATWAECHSGRMSWIEGDGDLLAAVGRDFSETEMKDRRDGELWDG
jgi:hypothetical protein